MMHGIQLTTPRYQKHFGHHSVSQLLHWEQEHRSNQNPSQTLQGHRTPCLGNWIPHACQKPSRNCLKRRVGSCFKIWQLRNICALVLLCPSDLMIKMNTWCLDVWIQNFPTSSQGTQRSWNLSSLMCEYKCGSTLRLFQKESDRKCTENTRFLMKVAILLWSFLRGQLFPYLLLHWGFHYKKNGGKVCTRRWIYHKKFLSDLTNIHLAPHSIIYSRSDLTKVLILPYI